MVIIAAVDRSDRATTVINEAKTLAEAFDEVIHVIHVLSRSEFVELERTSVDETGTGVSTDRVREIASEIADDKASNLDSEYEAIGLIGNPAEKIVEYSVKNDTRYIVVSGRKRSPTGKVLFGSVTQSVLLNAENPVVSTIGTSE